MSSDLQPASSDIYQPKKRMPNWGPEYLEALHKCAGAKIKAAKLIGLSYSAVYKATLSYPELGDAIDKARAEWDSKNLAALEEVSMRQAMKPGGTIERIFNLKSLNPSNYRDHAQPTTPTINIVMGFTIPDGRSSIGNEPNDYELPATARVIDAEDVKPTRSIRRRPSDDILGDDDVDIEL